MVASTWLKQDWSRQSETEMGILNYTSWASVILELQDTLVLIKETKFIIKMLSRENSRPSDSPGLYSTLHVESATVQVTLQVTVTATVSTAQQCSCFMSLPSQREVLITAVEEEKKILPHPRRGPRHIYLQVLFVRFLFCFVLARIHHVPSPTLKGLKSRVFHIFKNEEYKTRCDEHLVLSLTQDSFLWSLSVGQKVSGSGKQSFPRILFIQTELWNVYIKFSNYLSYFFHVRKSGQNSWFYLSDHITWGQFLLDLIF